MRAPTRRSRSVRLAAAGGGAALAAALLTSVAAVGPGAAPAAAAPPGWTLTWSDEFNAGAGTPVDGSKWMHDVGGGGWGNAQLEYDTNSTRNSVHDGQGNLLITARQGSDGYSCWNGPCQYTSARLNTSGRFTQQHGRLEARIKVPCGNGLWPAFWALGNDIGSVGWPNSGEIDVMENIGREPNKAYGTLHGPGYSAGSALTRSYTLNGRFCDGFHEFAADWSPSGVNFSIDGNVYGSVTPNDTRGNPWVFNKPFFLLLNLAVGGYWPGSPDGSTPFPATMAVDFVRVYRADSGGGGTSSTVVGLAGKCLDVQRSGTADGTQVQLYRCNGTDAQRWTRPGDGTLRAFGKCLDVNAASRADGARIQLWTCNGSGAQQWVMSGAGDLVNPPADKCADVREANSADSTPIQLYTCNGTAAQKWRYV